MILTLLERLEALEKVLYKDNHNSSKPPSSDGLVKKTVSLRESSGKPVGGQVGHKGSNLKQVAQATEIVNHPLPSHCLRCQQPLPQGADQVVERRQILYVPVTACQVIEHHALEYVRQCGQSHTSAFPEKVTEAVQYGPNLRALAIHLTQGQLLPFARAAQLIHDLYGIAVSPGTLVTWVAQASNALRSTAELIELHVRQAPILHAAESGLRVAGKLHWLHIAATQSHTWYGVHIKRGMEATRPEGEALNPMISKPGGKRGRTKQTVAFNLLYRLRLHGKAVLHYFHDPNVPFTNNLGERAICMPKVKQKISGCFRTLNGANHFSIIRSCLDTLHKQGYGRLEVLRRAFASQPIRPAACGWIVITSIKLFANLRIF